MRAKDILYEGYTAYEIDNKSKRILLDRFPPKYPNFIGNHITYRMGDKRPLPSMPTSVEVVGYIDDGSSIEALVVEINGKALRPDGKPYHITWSLDKNKGKSPKHSNNLIASGNIVPVSPISINAKPEILK